VWKEITSASKRRNGTAALSATENFQSGTRILQVQAFGSALAGSVQIFRDATPITLPANSGWFRWQPMHNACVAPTTASVSVPGVTQPTGGDSIVLTQVGAYVIEYIEPAGAGGT
jgi:hypothetical protein